ncbi:MAG: VOC family protein [Hyphomonadaceae bacterium]
MPTRPTLSSALSYRDPKAAIEFLKTAFGFEPLMIISDEHGAVVHSELTLGDGAVMVGGEWSDDNKSPASLGGKNTQTIHIHLTTDVDAHCDHARRAGAAILQAPADQFYGDRTYRARDPEGHIWTFGQTKKALKAAEWDKAMPGLKSWVRPGSGYE